MENQKMKISKYISIAISSLIFGILAWVLASIDNQFVVLAGGVLALIAFAALTINVASFSVIGFIKSLKIKQEKGLWKILTLAFRIGMLVFAGLITILFIVWMAAGLSLISDFKSSENAIAMAFLYMLNTDASPLLNLAGKADLPAIFITIFVFIMLWCVAGITFEVIKKIFGGYKPKKANVEENNNN